MFDVIIFDMDGLLIDSERVAYRAYFQAAEDLGIPLEDKHFHEVLGTNSTLEQEILEGHFPNLNWTTFRSAIRANVITIYEEEGVPVKPGAIELLQYLQTEHIPAVVATSSAREDATALLTHADLIYYFEKLICGDEIQHSKPAPDIFLKALGNREASRALVLEDSHQGIEAANRANIPVIMVPDILTPPEGKNILYIMDSLYDVLNWLRQAR